MPFLQRNPGRITRQRALPTHPPINRPLQQRSNLEQNRVIAKPCQKGVHTSQTDPHPLIVHSCVARAPYVQSALSPQPTCCNSHQQRTHARQNPARPALAAAFTSSVSSAPGLLKACINYFPGCIVSPRASFPTDKYALPRGHTSSTYLPPYIAVPHETRTSSSAFPEKFIRSVDDRDENRKKKKEKKVTFDGIRTTHRAQS